MRRVFWCLLNSDNPKCLVVKPFSKLWRQKIMKVKLKICICFKNFIRFVVLISEVFKHRNNSILPMDYAFLLNLVGWKF